MKKSDANLKSIIALFALFGLSVSLMAQPHDRMPRPETGDHSRMDMMNLSDEQKSEIKDIHLSSMKEVQPLKDELKINKAKINALIKKDDPDMKEIVGLVEANGRILTQIQVKQIESRIKVRSLLTDDQKVIFDAHNGQMHRRRAMAEYHPQRRIPGRSRY